jgi:hypothetical protein
MQMETSGLGWGRDIVGFLAETEKHQQLLMHVPAAESAGSEHNVADIELVKSRQLRIGPNSQLAYTSRPLVASHSSLTEVRQW